MSSGLSVGERQGSKDGNRGRTGGGLDKQTNPWMVWVSGAGGDSTGEGHRAAPFTRAGLSCDKPSAVLEHLRVSYH